MFCIPSTPEKGERRVAQRQPTHHKETRQRLMLSSHMAATASLTTQQQQDVVEEFRDASALEAALVSVQRDLTEQLTNDQKASEEWVKSCLCVLQDLRHGGEMTQKCEGRTSEKSNSHGQMM